MRHALDGATVDALLSAADCALYVEEWQRARPEPPSILRLAPDRTVVAQVKLFAEHRRVS